MNVNLLFVSATCLLLVSQAPKPDATKQDLKKLNGTWVAVFTEIEGKKQSASSDESFWTFDGDKLTSRLKEKQGSGGKVKLDPTKSPKTIDIDFITPEGTTGTLVGIYQLREDGTLWLAFDGFGAGRPAGFATKSGSRHRLIELKKEK